MHEESYLARQFDDVYSGNRPGFFKPFVEDLMRHRSAFPTRPADRLVSTIEARRATSIQNVALVIGPLLGVIVGALITWLLTG